MSSFLKVIQNRSRSYFSRKTKSCLLHSCSFCDAKLGRIPSPEIEKKSEMLSDDERGSFYATLSMYDFLRCQIGTVVSFSSPGKRTWEQRVHYASRVRVSTACMTIKIFCHLERHWRRGFFFFLFF